MRNQLTGSCLISNSFTDSWLRLGACSWQNSPAGLSTIRREADLEEMDLSRGRTSFSFIEHRHTQGKRTEVIRQQTGSKSARVGQTGEVSECCWLLASAAAELAPVARRSPGVVFDGQTSSLFLGPWPVLVPQLRQHPVDTYY